MLCQRHGMGCFFKFLNASLEASHLQMICMHHGACVNTTLLCPTLLFLLICGRDLRDSTIRRHVEYKPAYSLAFTLGA
jgi:hypothetical protein